MLEATLVVLLASALAALTYLRLEPAGPRLWVPAVCRALAWSAIGLLLLNVSCPSAGAPRRPLVLLDGSLSMGAAGGRWREALDSARHWGDVRIFGDEPPTGDTVPSAGRSLLGPALSAAAASDRPVIVVSDGEIEDAGDLPPELLGRASVRLFPRPSVPDLAITSLGGPARVTAGDSVVLNVVVEGEAGTQADTAAIEVSSGSATVARRRIRLGNGASGRARLAFPSASLGPGDHVLRVRLAGAGDREPRTDTRLHLVTVAPTPGVVLVAAPGDWDSRFLYHTLREVAQLPVRGYVRLDADRWRTMGDLRPVGGAEVARAARGADLLILKGGAGSFVQGTTARGIWVWPSGEGGAPSIPGDWYLTGDESSPIGGAFLGQPVDSFPPVVQLSPAETAAGDWVGLTAQLGRRGAPRPAMVGRVEGRVRRVTTLVDGLWRWGFRGGSSEESYRALVAATASWLLTGADTAAGAARPVRRVVQDGRPMVFEWSGSGAPTPVPITWIEGDRPRADTLRFDGAGRASVRLPPGTYRYRFAGGAGGTVAVEEYSDELLPRRISLRPRNALLTAAAGRTVARDWLWLFGLCLLAFAGEWFARRRLGLR
ncbi:MAG TPA: hypothetical protein VJQ44_05520 [Gemmatimonadales bacterium]|nr:hypothetical protein [Gemmatimonadales bacterium]